MSERSADDGAALRELAETALDVAETIVPVGEDSARTLREMMESEELDHAALCRLVGDETAFAAEVMRAAHSPLFGGLPALRELEPALERIGTSEAIALLARTAERARSFLSSPWARPKLLDLVRRSRECAFAASWLARRAGLDHLAESAHLAGLLHNIGRLVLVRLVDDRHGAIPDEALDAFVSDHHFHVGARLLASWGLANDLVVAASLHQARLASASATPLVALMQLAGQTVGAGRDQPEGRLQQDSDELRTLGLQEGALIELRKRLVRTGPRPSL